MEGTDEVSVIITNISDRGTPNNAFHEYVVKINHEVITRFIHKRNEGLAECLRRAADAVDYARAGKEWKGNDAVPTDTPRL
jgi:hypothetical protein